MTERIAICVEYDGGNYHGWQVQKHAESVQGVLQAAIAKVAAEAVTVIGSGRTDTGVHASAQIAHFDTTAQRTPRQWLRGINTGLPPDIVVIWVTPVAAQFHARFAAQARTYRYVVHNREVRPGYLHGRVTWHRPALDEQRMQRAADLLRGRHDFTAFRAAGCQSRNPVREVREISVRREREWVYLDITANGFLHHMVRNIMGALLEIGSGEAEAQWAGTLLQSRDRTQGGITAPAAGLYFAGAEYAPEFDLPPTPPRCRFW